MALINSEPDRQHSLMSAFSYLKKPFTNKIALLLTALLCTFILISCEAAALEANPTTSDLTITDLTDAVQLQLTVTDSSEFPVEPDESEQIETESDESEPETTAPETEPEPIESDPIESEPVESEPVETEPVESEPVATEAKPAAAQINIAVSTGKIAYLTFDDGPDKNNTGRILDILDEYGVKATFFVVGTRAERYSGQLEDIAERGHAIGCHSYDHDYSKLKDADGLTAEISDWESAVEKILGALPPSKLFRFPGGSPIKDENNLKSTLAELGYNGFDWNCLNNDCLVKKCPADMTEDEWLKQSFIETYNYGSKLKNAPLIILMHETYSQTVDMLGWAIEFLQSEGYTFATLDELQGSWYY